jgi:hypothetical protein
MGKTSTILEYPITQEECKSHFRLNADYSDDDFEISRFIQSATDIIERGVGYDIAYKETTIEIEDFGGNKISVYIGNFKSLIGVYDANDVSINYDKVIVPNTDIPDSFQIIFPSSVSSNPLKIKFYSGWKTNEVNPGLANLVKIKAGDLYSRERGSYLFTSHQVNEKLIGGLLEIYRIY